LRLLLLLQLLLLSSAAIAASAATTIATFAAAVAVDCEPPVLCNRRPCFSWALLPSLLLLLHHCPAAPRFVAVC